MRAEASVEKLHSLFRKYAKFDSGKAQKYYVFLLCSISQFNISGFSVLNLRVLDEAYLNVMQFSNLFRVVTGQKGNLFNEMKMFNK